MKLYFYRGLEDEVVPKDFTRVIVDNNVAIVRKKVFALCNRLVSVIMGDNVKIINDAFWYCHALRFIKISKALEYIGEHAFFHWHSLEALFLPSTLKKIEYRAFSGYRSLRLLILQMTLISPMLVTGSLIIWVSIRL